MLGSDSEAERTRQKRTRVPKLLLLLLTAYYTSCTVLIRAVPNQPNSDVQVAVLFTLMSCFYQTGNSIVDETGKCSR